jgi:hypothetical protein
MPLPANMVLATPILVYLHHDIKQQKMFNLPFPFAAFNLLETQFKEHNAIILKMVRSNRLLLMVLVGIIDALQ